MPPSAAFLVIVCIVAGVFSGGFVDATCGYHWNMISETIREKLARQPFEPFVIRSSSGDGYKVRSPDLIVLMKTKVFVAEPRSDRAATVSYLHIAAIEEPGDGNGHRSRRGGGRRPRR